MGSQLIVGYNQSITPIVEFPVNNPNENKNSMTFLQETTY